MPGAERCFAYYFILLYVLHKKKNYKKFLRSSNILLGSFYVSSRYRGTGTATTRGTYVAAAAEKINERRTLVDRTAK